ncbi:MAG: class I SAM-dependent methyltransferase [Alphaproteobacteria bacterium]|nr:class I SAM-dependent methyltransferase [Alphaproteobacteria bacterium]
MSFAGQLYRAVFQPTVPQCPPRPWRTFLRLPVVFDLVSLALQLRDIGRLSRLKQDYVVEDSHHRDVHDYNAGVAQAKKITTTRRSEEIYEILATPPRDLREEKLLIVGPRNVVELYLAWLHGYRWRNIQAIDLYSMNPKIRPMNMEAMEFADASFDALTMSATLAYAEDFARAIGEVARVLKPGGRFVFGHPYDPGSPEWPGNLVRGSEIRKMLNDAGMEIYFHTALDKTNSAGNVQTTHRFGAVKIDGLPDLLDRVEA